MPDERRVPTAVGDLALRCWPGDGQRFLLVHGMSSNARMWDGVAAVLAAGGAAVAAVDLRGHGRSAKPDTGYSVAEVAGDLPQVLDALGWPDAVLAGQSWGCNVVLEAAARWPDRVSALACVDGGLGDLVDRFPTWPECEHALAPPKLAGLAFTTFEAGVRAAHADWPETGIQGVLGCFEVRADGTVAPWLRYDRHLQVLHGMWEHRLSEVYPRLRMPVLFIPADDPAAPEWTASKRAVLPAALDALTDGRVSWLTGVHDLHAQQPAAVAALLAALADRSETKNR